MAFNPNGNPGVGINQNVGINPSGNPSGFNINTNLLLRRG